MKGAAFGARRLLPAGLAFLGGLLAALAHPPYGLLPGISGYALILHALDRTAASPKPKRAAFLAGWAGGTGYLVVCTCWIVEPFLIDAASHAWQIPFAVLLCAGGIGVFWGFAGLLYRWLVPRPASLGPWRVLVFAAAFGLWEWLRGHMLTGFPWDLPGETWRAGSPLSQGAALVGAYGMTALALFVGAAPASLLDAGRLRRLAMPAAAAGLIAVLGVWGAAYLASPQPPSAAAPVVRLVQPNLPEPPAWSQAIVDQAVDRYTRLSALPAQGGRRPDIVIWPEGAIPESFNTLLAPGSAAGARIWSALSPGQVLLSGGVRVEADPSGRAPEGLYFNTLVALRRAPAGLELLGVYDKHHLVPFGEYLPFARFFGPIGVRKLVSVSSDFTPGPPPRPMVLPGPISQPLILQPLICYEALFPGIAPGDGDPRHRAQALVNVSDDAWFGRDVGPRQHLNIASYRAIEEGRPMLRVTPTGVSAVIDAHGQPLRRLEPSVEGVIDATLPSALPPTPYSRWRDLFFWLMVIAGFASSRLPGPRKELLFDSMTLSPHTSGET